MRNSKNGVIKAAIRIIIVALFFSAILLGIVFLVFKDEIDQAISYTDLISLDKGNNKPVDTTIDETTKRIINYPEYGAEYARIRIDKIDKDLPVYFGDDLTTLKKGVGHYSRKLLPR